MTTLTRLQTRRAELLLQLRHCTDADLRADIQRALDRTRAEIRALPESVAADTIKAGMRRRAQATRNTPRYRGMLEAKPGHTPQPDRPLLSDQYDGAPGLWSEENPLPGRQNHD